MEVRLPCEVRGADGRVYHPTPSERCHVVRLCLWSVMVICVGGCGCDVVRPRFEGVEEGGVYISSANITVKSVTPVGVYRPSACSLVCRQACITRLMVTTCNEVCDNPCRPSVLMVQGSTIHYTTEEGSSPSSSSLAVPNGGVITWDRPGGSVGLSDTCMVHRCV